MSILVSRAAIKAGCRPSWSRREATKRAGSGNLNSGHEWIFGLNAA